MKGFSLKMKSIIAVMAIALFLSVLAVFISYKIYSKTMNEHYKSTAMNIAKVAASQMDGDKILEYIRKVEEVDKNAPDYKEQIQAIKDEKYFEMLDILFDLKVSLNALYLYVEKVSKENVVYILDADKEGSACELGEIYPSVEKNHKYLKSLEKGVPAFISNTEFGWLCSAGAPIFDKHHRVVALAFTDISMNKIMKDRHKFLYTICIALVYAAAIATCISIFFVHKFVVHPINTLSTAASKFISEKNNFNINILKDSVISKLNIHTGDEIENLCNAIKTMEDDIRNYIENLTAITVENERISTELNVAMQIQAAMLPCIFPAFPEREEFDIYAMMQPAKEVGGDFYDYFLIDYDHLAVIIADVSGKGVPAALFMVIAKTLIKNQTQAGLSPQKVFTSVNTQLCENNEAGMFVTAWMGVLELSTGRFQYVNAGHNRPFLKRNGGFYEYIKSRAGFVLAGMEGINYKQYEMQLEPGDELYLYTDGVIEAFNRKNEPYGEYRLQEVLNKNKDTSPMLLLEAVKKDIDTFSKIALQSNDITMLSLKIKEISNE